LDLGTRGYPQATRCKVLARGQRYERELSDRDLHLVVGRLAQRQQTFVLGLAAALPAVLELSCSIAEFGRGEPVPIARTIDRSGSAGGFAERARSARLPREALHPFCIADAGCPAFGRPTSSVGGGVAMFARQSTIQGKADQADTGIRNFNEQILPAVRQLKGFTGAQLLVDRKGGKVVVTTFWETEQALRDSESKANELRRTAAAQVQATSEPLVEQFEVAVMTEIKQPAHA
jgi:heme-degrading monooxygenase HmoA